MTWQHFVVAAGGTLSNPALAFILGRTEPEVRSQRRGVNGRGGREEATYADVFTKWHGRAPEDHEWPIPGKSGGGGYVWQGRELAFLASLVGTMSKDEMSRILTLRLRKITGDPKASRKPQAVQNTINRIGMQVGDVVGGITPADAGREIGIQAAVYQALERGELTAKRVGRNLVIPHADWARWKSKRSFIPEGYVRLSSIRERLSIRSDKLSEMARLGHIPTAVQCNLYGVEGKNQQGIWYIDGAYAEQLVADRRLGKPMPWHGKAIPDNLRGTWATWKRKRHAASCETCRAIWGAKSAPRTFADFCLRYPGLGRGEKRHLTFSLTPDLSIRSITLEAKCTAGRVKLAIANGMLRARGKPARITRIDATRWIARRMPTGTGERSWISLASAMEQYGLDAATLNSEIKAKRLKQKCITNGPSRGQVFVARQQCKELAEARGMTLPQAATRLGITIERARELLEGLDWRGGSHIALSAVQAMAKRIAAKSDRTLEDAAAAIRKPVEWVRACVDAGLVKTRQPRWHPGKQIISAFDIQVLRELAKSKTPIIGQRARGMTVSHAAHLAGLSSSTLNQCANEGELAFHHGAAGREYEPDAVRAFARNYWQSPGRRRTRREPPAWLAKEVAAEARQARASALARGAP